MTPQAFLERELTNLAETFPDTCFRYGFDEIIDTYVVQIDPVEAYYKNLELDKVWVPVALAFDKQFDECITFIASDSPLKLEKAERTWNAPAEEIVCSEEEYEAVA